MKKLLVFYIVFMLFSVECFCQITLNQAKDLISFTEICLSVIGSNDVKCPSCTKISSAKTYHIGKESIGINKYLKSLNVFNCKQCNYIEFRHLYFNQNNILITQKVIFKSK